MFFFHRLSLKYIKHYQGKKQFCGWDSGIVGIIKKLVICIAIKTQLRCYRKKDIVLQSRYIILFQIKGSSLPNINLEVLDACVKKALSSFSCFFIFIFKIFFSRDFLRTKLMFGNWRRNDGTREHKKGGWMWRINLSSVCRVILQKKKKSFFLQPLEVKTLVSWLILPPRLIHIYMYIYIVN